MQNVKLGFFNFTFCILHFTLSCSGMKKPVIAFVTGGYSTEAVISYKSAETIEKHVDKDKFDVYKIDITPKGWFYESGKGIKTAVTKEDFSLNIGGKAIHFNAVLIGIH